MYNKNKIINSWIGLNAKDNYVVVLETIDSYFVQYWDDINCKIAIDEIGSETAIMFIDNAEMGFVKEEIKKPTFSSILLPKMNLKKI